jgi:hypothetical protein
VLDAVETRHKKRATFSLRGIATSRLAPAPLSSEEEGRKVSEMQGGKGVGGEAVALSLGSGFKFWATYRRETVVCSPVDSASQPAGGMLRGRAGSCDLPSRPARGARGPGAWRAGDVLLGSW